jgi:hypothetical protein
MAKLTKEELIQKIDSLSISDDEKISLMEDISDSMAVTDTTELDSVKAELEKALMDVEDLKAKYKARFLSGEVMIEDTPAEEVVEEPSAEEEPEVIDVKDIFTSEDEEKKEDEENA